jgi:hypothetical protein
MVAACGGDSDEEPDATEPAATEPSEATPEGSSIVVDVEVTSRDHVVGEVDYETSPPAGGDHFGVWQNCGFYTVALLDEVAVHSLEHGVVWVTYLPGTDPATLEAIEARVDSESHLLASPYDDQASPLMLTAWGRQLEVASWTDPAVDRFIEDHVGRRSPTAPEPGASCEGAIGVPPGDALANYDEAVELMAEGS